MAQAHHQARPILPVVFPEHASARSDKFYGPLAILKAQLAAEAPEANETVTVEPPPPTGWAALPSLPLA